MIRPWRVLASRHVVADRWIRVRADHCQTAEGVDIDPFYVLEYPDWVQIVAISSNSTITHPQDGPEGLRAQAERQGWNFPYLFDASQAVAKAFQAACTPDLFLFDVQHQLVYRGQLDGSRPGNDEPLTGADLRAAIEDLLAGRAVNPDQRPSIGCNIKWHPEKA